MKPNADQTRHKIWTSALLVIEREGAAGLTLERVAAEAGCAKGLVNYHFQSKTHLIAEVIRHHAQRRREAWRQALEGADAQAAIARTWGLVVVEARDVEFTSGTLGTLGPDPAKEILAADLAFVELVSNGVSALLENTGLRFDVPARHAGAMLVAAINGSVARLALGASRAAVEEGYALAWLGLLGLTVPINAA